MSLRDEAGEGAQLRAALPLVKQVIRDLAADSDFWFDTVWAAVKNHSSGCEVQRCVS